MNPTRIMLLGIAMIMLGATITLDTTTGTRGSLILYPGFGVVLFGFVYGLVIGDDN
ncbi:MAG: hypothetical protein LRY73_12520 [Bacillus sp. (in: Bacteria)]|nr:hypothetical protein [Bacillus sp. (in: firmicutes)]